MSAIPTLTESSANEFTVWPGNGVMSATVATDSGKLPLKLGQVGLQLQGRADVGGAVPDCDLFVRGPAVAHVVADRQGERVRRPVPDRDAKDVGPAILGGAR